MKFLLAFLFVPISLFAQENSLVLMGLAAHPDDEDGATLAYYAKLKNAKIYSLIYTRGEGGQNEIGTSLYDDLAELRTQETFEAAKLLGAETYFLNFRDFGFSKTAKETFHIWGGKDAVLARVVYYIRKLRPMSLSPITTQLPQSRFVSMAIIKRSAFPPMKPLRKPLIQPSTPNNSQTAFRLGRSKNFTFASSAPKI